MDKSGLKFHVSISVAGAIELPDEELKSWIGLVYSDGKPLRTVRDIRRKLAEECAAGNEYIRQQRTGIFMRHG